MILLYVCFGITFVTLWAGLIDFFFLRPWIARKTWGRDHSRDSATAKTGSPSLPESARPQDDPSWFMADLIERTVKPK